MSINEWKVCTFIKRRWCVVKKKKIEEGSSVCGLCRR